MPNNKCDVCPCCKRHCSVDCPRCKCGKKYFAEKRSKEDTPKWAQNLSPDGPVFQLLLTSKRVKKALRKETVTESCLFDAFSPQDLQLFRNFLACIEQSTANFK